VGKSPKAEPEFRFRTKEGGGEERVYRLIQTVVRRVHEGEPVAKPAVKKAKSKTSGKKKRR
jgi:hypothetical protein